MTATTVADNIWELAIAQQKQRLKTGATSKSSGSERNLLIVGSKNVGKTTLVHRFVERTETPKPTLALEYTFGRKNNQHLARVS